MLKRWLIILYPFNLISTNGIDHGYIIDGYIIVKVWCNFFAGVLCSTLDIGPWNLQFVFGFRKNNWCERSIEIHSLLLCIKKIVGDTKDLNNLLIFNILNFKQISQYLGQFLGYKNGRPHFGILKARRLWCYQLFVENAMFKRF